MAAKIGGLLDYECCKGVWTPELIPVEAVSSQVPSSDLARHSTTLNIITYMLGQVASFLIGIPHGLYA